MDRLGVRELRVRTSEVLRRAQAGERILLTVDGRPVAQVGPIEPPAQPATIDDLVARGLALAPRRADRGRSEVALALVAGSRLDRLLREVRGA